jgi:hypothetical protein
VNLTVGTGKIDIEKRPHVVLNREYLSMLAAGGLLDFDSIYNFQDGAIIKQIRDRSVIRLEISEKDGNRTFYLKRHNPVRLGLLAMIVGLFGGTAASPGMAEFIHLCRFRKHGIPTVVPVAAGERRTGFGRYESFLLTEDFTPYISLEELIFNRAEILQGAEGLLRKERLIRTIALLARKMHDEGFNHRDFNATHVLVGPDEGDGDFHLALFDLQRIDRKKWLKINWLIKTMAHLSFSMPAPLFDDQDRLHLFQTYKGTSNLRMMDRFQLHWIGKKKQRIKRHTENIMKRRKQSAKTR